MAKIVLAGGTGLLGSILARHLAPHYDLIILSRRPAHPTTTPQTIPWDARTLGPPRGWQHHLENAAALINLTGRSVNCRYNPKNRRQILESRTLSTAILGQAIAQCHNPPPVWLNASTATIYRHSFTPQDELTGTIGATPEAQDAFSIEVATAWEKALADAPTPRTRKVALRTAMVLSTGKNSVFPILRLLTRLGFGGNIAGGNQFVSWIHELDFCRAVEFLLTQNDLSGPINLAAPNPLPLADFMQKLRDLLRPPIAIPTPKLLLEIGCFLLRTEPELLIKSRCVIPTRLHRAGFQFKFPTAPEALANLTGAS